MCLKKPEQSAPKSSCCAGFPMADTRFEKLCASSGTSAPPDATRETEDYRVELSEVTVLELVIVPDKSRGAARASLKSLRVS